MLQSGFAHATASKVLFVLSLASLMFEDVDHRFGLGVQHVGNLSQWWRVLTSQLIFSRTDGAIFGALAFYHTRQIERQLGTSKFVGFAAFVTIVASLLQLQLLYAMPETFAMPQDALSPGPYALGFALLMLYWRWVPRRRRVVSSKIFGIPLTEKFMTYLFISQCFFAGGFSTLIPALTGAVPAGAYLSGMLPTNVLRTPGFLNDVLSRIAGPLVTTPASDEIRPNLPTQEQQRQRDLMRQQRGGVGGVGVNAQGNFVSLLSQSPFPFCRALDSGVIMLLITYNFVFAGSTWESRSRDPCTSRQCWPCE
eukprot:INCI16049.2.p1 GENE.INCI16049.2~~INCI16049.2.p1  ORF type:complete len:309 (+),score=26.72 INCI16049.2:114-1040(+)